MADTIKLEAKAVILAKVETTYGTDPTPVPNTNGIRVEALKCEPQFKSMVRGYYVPYMGAKQSISIGQGVKVNFKTEIKGSGVLGTVPEIGCLFRACNFTETIVPATSVAYDPNSLMDSAESITIYVYIDGTLRKVVGCRGTGVFDVKAGEYGYITWDFTGIYAGPADQAIVTPTLSAVIPPRFVSASFSLDTFAAVIDSLKITIGNTIASRPSANAATGMLQYFIKDRKIVANIDPEVVALATKDWEGKMSTSALMALSATIGTVAGNKLTITASKAQVESLKDAAREGIWTQDLTLNLTPNTGNDEVDFLFN